MASLPGFPIKKAQLIALLLESIVFGIFLTFFLILIAISCAKNEIRLANRRFVLIVATLMMAMSITHLVISFVRVIRMFTTGHTDGREPNPSLMKLSDPIRDSKALIYSLQILLGDAVLVWRCCIVYNKSLYVIVPTATVLLGNVVLSILISVSLFNSPPGTSFFNKGAWQIIAIAAFLIITMCLNLSCTIAIVVKLWRSHMHSVSSYYGQSLFPVMAAIVESGALYTAGVSSLVVTFLVRSNGLVVPMDMITPLVGVVFCLIILQLHFQMRILKPSSTGATGRSILHWEVHDRALIHGLRGGVAIHTTQHASTN